MKAQIPLREIACKVGATVIGDSEQLISAICSLDEPLPNALSFIKEASQPRMESLLASANVAALLVPDHLSYPQRGNIALLPVKDPLAALVQILPLFFPEPPIARTVSAKADIHPSASIGRNVAIGPFCAIGEDVVIEDDVTLHPHVTVYRDVIIGKGAVIHSGAVLREGTRLGAQITIQNGAIIGADGFGYFPAADANGRPTLVKVPQVGRVVIEANVEIGANACVDRATLGSTKIGVSSKIDNLVQIGHNTKIGAMSIACGQVGIAGSCTIGNGVVLGGAVGVGDHITIADGVRIAGRGGVIEDLTEKGDYAGFPATRVMSWRKTVYALQRLPELIKLLPKKPRDGTK